jgi:preprotein translocase subunit SecG
MQSTVLIVHTLIALGIIALVLLQRGKGAEAGAAFGAGASGTVFGARGSTSFFSRTTALLATAFFATSLTLAYMSSQSSGEPESLIENVPAVEAEQRLPEVGPTDEAISELPELDSADAEVEDADMPALEDVEAPVEDEQSPQE